MLLERNQKVQSYRLHLCFVNLPTCRNLFRPHHKHTFLARLGVVCCITPIMQIGECVYGGGVRYRPGVQIRFVTPTDYL